MANTALAVLYTLSLIAFGGGLLLAVVAPNGFVCPITAALSTSR